MSLPASLPGVASILSHPILLLLAAASWILLFRPAVRAITLGFGAFVVSLAIEYYLVPLGLGYDLLIAAPLVEECMKFLLNWKKNFAGGVSVGLGFSIFENASYFILFHNMPIFLEEIIVRSFSDVPMHSFNACLSSYSWKGIGKLRFGLPAAIGIHDAFNFCALKFVSGVSLYVSLSLWTITLISLLVLFKKRSFHEWLHLGHIPPPFYP